MTVDSEIDAGAVFDRILERVGNDGRFQTRFNYIFNLGMSVFASLIYYNIIMAMSVPDHWCHVPGREQTNLTVDEWKALTLPKELNNRLEDGYSHCLMYSNPPESTIINNTKDHFTIGCANGFEYDHTWFQNTIITDNNWVCDKELYKFNAFMFDRCGEVMGTFVFGQLGDRFGRRIVFNISIFALVTGRMVQILFSSMYWTFAAAAVYGSVLANALFQAPFIIAMEIVKPDERANVNIMQAIARSIGMCLMPMAFWAFNDWKLFMWITSLPIVAFLCFPSYMIESPRWLALNSKWNLSAKFLNRIARVNGRSIQLTGEQLKEEMSVITKAPSFGITSLFTARQLAKNTILLIACWICASVGYFMLILLISQLPGNPFLNFFGQSAIEIPSFFMAGYLCDKYGRRFTNVLSFAFATSLCAVTTVVVLYSSLETVAIGLTIFIKFCASVAVFSVYLQSVEIYPTCLRQTGISLGMILSNLIGTLGPYAVLASKYDSRYPYYIIGLLFFIGMISSACLPETLHQKLPDSIEEAAHFGRDQAFWSLPKRTKITPELIDVNIELLRSENTVQTVIGQTQKN